MVILIILGILAIALTLTTQMSDAATQLERLQRFNAGREANYMVARSAFELALQLVLADDDETDGPEDLWATGPQRLNWEGRELLLEVQDEERRFPVMALVPRVPVPQQQFEPTEEQQAWVEALARFAERAGQTNQAAYALVDWMDADRTPVAGGTETPAVSDLDTKNAPLDSLQELRFIQGWGNPSLPQPPPLGGLVSSDGVEELEAPEESALQESARDGSSRWDDWLTLYSEGKININTAPREILASLDEEMTPTIVDDIVKRRNESSLSGEQDLREIAGINADMAFRLERLVTYSSKHFRIRVIVDAEPGRVALEAVVVRDKENPKVLVWEVR